MKLPMEARHRADEFCQLGGDSPLDHSGGIPSPKPSGSAPPVGISKPVIGCADDDLKRCYYPPSHCLNVNVMLSNMFFNDFCGF